MKYGTERLLIVFDRRKAELRAIYDDRLLPYLEKIRSQLGLSPSSIRITRASYVEPDPQRRFGNYWQVDLRDLGGGIVYHDESGEPFVSHKSAVAFERRWLVANWLRPPLDV